MSKARNDRNTVQFGPSRTPQSYKLDRLEEEVKDLERETVQSINNTTQEITQYVDQSITNITGNAELLIGTVVTYNPALSTGTVTIDIATVDFYNASSVRLEVDDVIILSANEDYPDPFCVGLISRDGFPLGYDIYGFVIPSQIPGLPERIEPWYQSFGNFGGLPQVVGTVYYQLAGTNTIQYEDYDTGASGAILLPTVHGGATASFSINDTVICYTKNFVGGTFSAVETYVFDGTTWTGYPYKLGHWHPNPQGGNSYGVFLYKIVAGVLTDGPWLVEVDNAGALTETDLSAIGMTAGGIPIMTVGGGHVVIAVPGYSNNSGHLYIDGTVHTYVFNQNTAISAPQAGASPSNPAAHRYMSIYGDYLYYAYRENGERLDSFVSPTTSPLSLGIIDLTAAAPTAATIPQLLTSTGNMADGEPVFVQQVLALDNSKVAIPLAVRWSFFDAVEYAAVVGDLNADKRYGYAVVDTSASTITAIYSNEPDLVPGSNGVGANIASARDHTVIVGFAAAQTGTVGEMVVHVWAQRYDDVGSSYNLTYPELLMGENV
jgi:hypothetical protein